MTDAPPLTIVRLTAENVKRIEAVTIEPDPEGNLVIIAGRNGQGKTSLLDSIALALGGGKQGKETTLPIRKGQTKASVEIDFGDFTVTKQWIGDAKPTLVVMAKGGSVYPSPQKFLDSLMGNLSFDPLAFTRLKAGEQVDALLAVAPLPFDPLEVQAEYDMVFGQRTDVNRAIRNLEGELAGFDAEVDEAPDQPVSTQAIFEQLAEVEAVTRQQDQVRADLSFARRALAQQGAEVERLQAELGKAQHTYDDTGNEVLALEMRVNQFPEPPDPSSYREQLGNAEAVNERVRLKHEKAAIAAKHVTATNGAAALTRQLEDIVQRRKDGLKAAGEAMPVPGLLYDDTGVTFNGIPFAQCSGAEQLRVSTAIAMAANPKIGVIRITDGSLLDADNLEVLREMAAVKGHQVWIEIVSPGEIGFVIEDGSLKS